MIKPVSDASQRILGEDDLIKLTVFYKRKVLLVVAGVPREGAIFPRSQSKLVEEPEKEVEPLPLEGWDLGSFY